MWEREITVRSAGRWRAARALWRAVIPTIRAPRRVETARADAKPRFGAVDEFERRPVGLADLIDHFADRLSGAVGIPARYLKCSPEVRAALRGGPRTVAEHAAIDVEAVEVTRDPSRLLEGE